jgi:non-lysosomal glucosylceramidase
MPLGGIGTGHVAICGDGALRQWQLLGRPNHAGCVPDSFFAIRCARWQHPTNIVRILQSDAAVPAETEPAPLVSDGDVPRMQRELLERYGGVAQTTIEASYPIARIAYRDPELPVSVALSAWNPLVPLDEAASALPVAVFDFELENETSLDLSGMVVAALQNFIGWDGFTELESSESALYGGNVNRLSYDADAAWISMDNPSLADHDARSGQCVLAAHGQLVIPFERWSRPDELLGFVRGTCLGADMPWRSTREYLNERLHGPSATVPHGPSPPGRTWDGALALPFTLAPGERTTLRFTIAWHFPNRVVDFQQPGAPRPYGRSVFWLGNAYAKRFRDAEHVTAYVSANAAALEPATRRWTACFADSSVEGLLAEGLAAQPVAIRTPTCFVGDDERFYGFEGSLGASTTMWSGDWGGSCALNCTHVWNYEQALSRLFPRLEQSMRETELEVTQAPDGSLPHRVLLPTYLPQLWDEDIGGPTRPALDGMLGCPLKLYREMRQGASLVWLERLWPRLAGLMSHVSEHWDTAGDGVLRGEQPNTYDMSFYGANTYMGSLWLAALLAFARLAGMVGEQSLARDRLAKFRQAQAAYEELLWNGNWYTQEQGEDLDYQYGRGCLADQLLGQWWASQLRLGYVLAPERVRAALESIVAHNFQHDLGKRPHGERVFADGADSGVVNCTWPDGGRPARPPLYCDEVWTGTEYAVAHMCLTEGLGDAGLEILRAVRRRHDGTRRNPFNEIECGDHYARAMAGWPLVEALGGWSYSAVDGSLELLEMPVPQGARTPFVAAGGWGELSRRTEDSYVEVSVSCHWGSVELSRVSARAIAADAPTRVTLAGRELDAAHARADAEPGSGEIVFGTPIAVEPGATLVMRWPAQRRP